MSITLRPVSDYAAQFGVKCIAYGPPGGGKTPAIDTAPRPVMLITEPGVLSLRHSSVPSFDALTPERIDQFFDWLVGSNETKNFDTVCIDSGSQMAETILLQELSKTSKGGAKRHGLEAYGDMARKAMMYFRNLFFLQQKHVYIVAKQMMLQDGSMIIKKPYFPGQELNVQVPHLYDLVMHCDLTQHQQQGQVKAFRTVGTLDILARDRSGKLAELEPINLAYIFDKIMKG